MLFLKLNVPEDVNKFCNICTKYKDKMDVDVKYGRYVIDGCSVLAVSSLIGKLMKICPRTDDELLLTYFVKDVEDMGGYTIKNKNKIDVS